MGNLSQIDHLSQIDRRFKGAVTCDCNIHMCSVFYMLLLELAVVFINPRRACAARVTVLGLSVYLYSSAAGNEGTLERYQQLQCNKRSKKKMGILLKRRSSIARNWHYR